MIRQQSVRGAAGFRSQRRLAHNARVFGSALLYILGLLIAWALVVRLFSLRPYLLPGPLVVLEAGGEQGRLLLTHAWITVYEVLVGFAIAAITGVGLAITIVYSPLLRRFILPTLVAFNATPKVAVAPILIIWLGLGVPSKIALAFLMSFFPVVINTARGLSDVHPDLLAYFRLMQASTWNTFRKARLPNSLPYMFDGFKIALPIAMIGAVIGEFVAGGAGIGHQIILAYANFNTALVFAALIFIAIVSMLMFQVLVVVERLLLRWRQEDSAS